MEVQYHGNDVGVNDDVKISMNLYIGMNLKRTVWVIIFETRS